MLRWVLGPVQSSFEKEEIQVDKVKAFLITPSAGHDIDLYPITFGKKKGQVNPMHVIFIILLAYTEAYSGSFTLSEKTGAVIWKNFKVADNLLSGMEWSTVTPEIINDGFSMIDGALVIGKS